MSSAPRLAEIAALIGDPSRANMLAALMGAQALTASQLAASAGITAPTASGHLARLLEGGLVAVLRQGRHRHYRLASPLVARMLESVMVVAGATLPAERVRRATPRVPPALREARTCYDHLAGQLGVGIADALLSRGHVRLEDDTGGATESGLAWFAALGVDVDPRGSSRRVFCRPCLDWSERRPHLAGALGAALCARCEGLGWIRRVPGTRAVTVTEAGRRGFAAEFGLAV